MMERMMEEQGITVSINKAFDNILAQPRIFEGMNLTIFLKIYIEEILKRVSMKLQKLIVLVESLRLG